MKAFIWRNKVHIIADTIARAKELFSKEGFDEDEMDLPDQIINLSEEFGRPEERVIRIARKR